MQEEELAGGGRLELLDEEEPDCCVCGQPFLLDVMPNPWRGNEIVRGKSVREEARRTL